MQSDCHRKLPNFPWTIFPIQTRKYTKSPPPPKINPIRRSTHTRTHACTHTCTHARTHAHTHTHTHAHTRTHTHTHTHTKQPPKKQETKYHNTTSLLQKRSALKEPFAVTTGHASFIAGAATKMKTAVTALTNSTAVRHVVSIFFFFGFFGFFFFQTHNHFTDHNIFEGKEL